MNESAKVGTRPHRQWSMRPPVWLSSLTLVLLIVAWFISTSVVMDMPAISNEFCCEKGPDLAVGFTALTLWIPAVGYAVVHWALRSFPRLYWLETVGAFIVVAFYFVWVPTNGYPSADGVMQVMLLGALATIAPLLAWMMLCCGRRATTSTGY